MRPWNSNEASRMRRLAYGVAMGSILTVAACSVLIDRSSTECQVDADCERFGVHPSCRSGACVDTKVPCTFGPYTDESSLLNACSPGAILSFDDCDRLKVCDGAAPPPLVMPPDPTLASPPSADGGVIYRTCASLANGAQVPVVTGSSNFPTVLDGVASLIANPNGASQLQKGPPFIWQTTSSCTAAAALWSDNQALHQIHDPTAPTSPSQYAQFYGAPDVDGGQPCLLGDAGATVTVAESDVYSTTCNSNYTTSGDITDHQGPIQAMAFVVPSTSSETAISQNAAYEVFGLGGNGDAAAPWVNPLRYLIRSKTAGTQLMIAKEINVPADQFWGQDQHTAANLAQALHGLNGEEANQSIGILSISVYDGDRNNLRALAYRRTDQFAAYLPDSTPTSMDQANVRDGHYPIWGPLHFFLSSAVTTDEAQRSGGASPSSAFVDYFAVETVNQAVLDKFIQAWLIPPCAMSVSRSGSEELGEMTPFQPMYSCGCYFAAQADGKAPPQCVSCDGASDCPAARPACNYHFCEER